jgi:hypothetical protein
MLGCYIFCSEILVEVDQMGVKVKGRSGLNGKIQIRSNQQQVEDVNRQVVNRWSCGN